MENNDYVNVCNELINSYEKIIRKKHSDFNSAYANYENMIKSKVEEYKQNNMIISSEFLLKIKYALSLIGRFLTVSVLGVDHSFVSFDSYEYYKNKHNFNSESSIDFEEKVKNDIGVKMIYDHTIKCINFFGAFYDEIKKAKSLITNDELAKTFFNKFISFPSDTNYFLRLVQSMESIGMDISETMKLNKGVMDLSKYYSGPPAKDVDSIIEKYSHLNTKGTGRSR